MLADEVALGDYRVCAQIDDTRAEQVVAVKRYSLPRLKTDIRLDRVAYQVGDRVAGEVCSSYFFGEPVSRAQVEINLAAFSTYWRPLASVKTRTDGDGRCRFSLRIPAELPGPAQAGHLPLRLDCAVVDTSGHTETMSKLATLSGSALGIDVVPEGGHFVRGLESTAFAIVTGPDGRPTEADVVLAADGQGQSGETDARGSLSSESSQRGRHSPSESGQRPRTARKRRQSARST